MTRARWAVAAIALVTVVARGAGAQAADSGRVARHGEVGERRFRERLARIVQDRLGLTNEQLTRLQAVSRRHADERQEMYVRERALRAGIRRDMVQGEGRDSLRQLRVASRLDSLLALQRRRVEVVVAEQRELAAFLTPFQRARYLELQEQARRRLEQARWDRQGRGRRRPR